MDYFAHDTKALSDDKLLALRIDAGLEAVAVYWAVLEKIYADEAPFDVSETNVETKSVLFRLGLGFEGFETYVNHMCDIGLLQRDVENPNVVMSKRAESQIEMMDKKREIARQNGKKGGRKTIDKPKRNQRRNQKGTNAKTDVEPTSPQYKHIGFHKENQICKASDDATAAKAASSSVPICPLCETPLERTGMPDPDFFWCGKCKDFFAEAKAGAGDAA